MIRDLKGFTLIEVVVYSAILAVVFTFVVNMIMAIATSFNHARVEREVNEQGSFVTGRMMREVRLAKSVDLTSSAFHISPGALGLQTVKGAGDDTPTTRRFSLQNEMLMLQDGSEAPRALTQGVRVTSLIFERVGPVATTSWFVRKNGNDSSDCRTGLTACRTIQAAENKADDDGSGAGDVIYVGAGTYNEKVVFSVDGIQFGYFQVIADTAGTKTGDAGAVILDGTGLGLAVSGFDVGQRAYMNIDGFEIRNFSKDGVIVWSASNNIVLQNLKIHNNLQNGMFFASSLPANSNIQILNSTIYANGDQAGEYGIKLRNADNVVVKGVTLYQNYSGGISMQSGSNGTFENIVSHSHTTTNAIGLEDTTSGSRYKNILVYNNNGRGIHIWDYASNIIFTSITSYKNGMEGFRASSPASNITLKDSIIANNNKGIEDACAGCLTHTYNMLYNNTAGNYSGTSAHATEITANPLFVDPDGADNILGGAGAADDKFQLSQIAAGQASNSPAIDQGSQTALLAKLDTKTTRTDGITDAGAVDLGYHYSLSPEPLDLFISSPISELVRIDMRIEGGAGKLQTIQEFWGSAVLRRSYAP